MLDDKKLSAFWLLFIVGNKSEYEVEVILQLNLFTKMRMIISRDKRAKRPFLSMSSQPANQEQHFLVPFKRKIVAKI